MPLSDLVTLSLVGARRRPEVPAPMQPATRDPAPLAPAEADFVYQCIRCVQLQHAVFSSVVFAHRVSDTGRSVLLRVKLLVPDRRVDASSILDVPFDPEFVRVHGGEDSERAMARHRAEQLAQMQGSVPTVLVQATHEMHLHGWEFADPKRFVERYARFVRDHVREALFHEVDEMLLVNGEREFDPHVVDRITGKFVF